MVETSSGGEDSGYLVLKDLQNVNSQSYGNLLSVAFLRNDMWC